MTPTRARYLPIVESMALAQTEKAKELRCSILLIRDNATKAKQGCCEDAGEVLNTVERLATSYAFSNMSETQLSTARYNLGRLVMAASGLESLNVG